MTLTQKVILIALLVLGGVALVVGLTLSHYIGGFLRTVEEEARAEEARDGREAADVPTPADAPDERQDT